VKRVGILLALAALLVAVPVSGALATKPTAKPTTKPTQSANGHKWAYGKSAFRVKGSVVSTDATAGTVVVHVNKLFLRGAKGYKPVKTPVADITLSLSSTSLVYLVAGGARAVVTVDKILAGFTLQAWGQAKPDKNSSTNLQAVMSVRKLTAWAPAASPAP
jgi:hypothetical protein